MVGMPEGMKWASDVVCTDRLPEDPGIMMMRFTVQGDRDYIRGERSAKLRSGPANAAYRIHTPRK